MWFFFFVQGQNVYFKNQNKLNITCKRLQAGNVLEMSDIQCLNEKVR